MRSSVAATAAGAGGTVAAAVAVAVAVADGAARMVMGTWAAGGGRAAERAAWRTTAADPAWPPAVSWRRSASSSASPPLRLHHHHQPSCPSAWAAAGRPRLPGCRCRCPCHCRRFRCLEVWASCSATAAAGRRSPYPVIHPVFGRMGRSSARHRAPAVHCCSCLMGAVPVAVPGTHKGRLQEYPCTLRQKHDCHHKNEPVGHVSATHTRRRTLTTALW
mmetsp:Transcript_33992/g.97915  ORF Transcript_33992/g.97915 Transcript_33992/m.97915 type:complete len:218 (-) Transcript_33992:106-759(-)